MDTNEDWYLEASIGSESPAPPRVRAPASERLLMSLLGRGMRNISGNTTKLCSRFAVGDFELNYWITQTTDSTSQHSPRVTVHLHSNSISDYNELNKWQVFILSKCRGHPRQCAFITFSSVKLFSSECLKNILIAIVYLQFWCAGRSYLSSDQPLLWQ